MSLDKFMSEITPLDQAKTNIKMRVSACIDDAIKAKGWNQKTFAEKMGKRPSEISKWLSGTHNFTLDTLTEIANKLEVSFFDLLVLIKDRVYY